MPRVSKPRQNDRQDDRPALSMPAPALDARLVPAGDEVLAQMRARFFGKLADLTQQATGPDADPALQKAVWLYCYNASKNRALPRVAQLQEMTAQGAAYLHKRRQTLPTGIKTSLGKRVIAEAEEQSAKVEMALIRHYDKERREFAADYPLWRHDMSAGELSVKTSDFGPPPPLQRLSGQREALEALFGNRQRLYFHLDDRSASPIAPLVEEKLGRNGFDHIDYQAGYASDPRGNRRKIGKLIKDTPGLLRAFNTDPFRSNKDLMVVISRHPYDIGRGSFKRGWESCRSKPINVINDGGPEAAIGVLAAYLIRPDDPNIHDPLARMFIKPYFGDVLDSDGNHQGFGFTYKNFTPIGLHHPGFMAAMNDFTDKTFNEGKYGTFWLPGTFCEFYQEYRFHHLLPDNAEQALSMMGKDFTKAADGRIIIDDDLKMKNMGLHKLPDLRDVVINGTLDLRHNKLLSLRGLPCTPPVSADCSKNLIVSFNDCTMPAVQRYFSYRENPFLMSAAHIPKARGYRYGNHVAILDDEQERLHTGTKPLCPTTHPDKFRGMRIKP